MDYKREYERLQQRADDERREEARREEDAYHRREEERRQRRQAEIEAQCYAETWDEAFRKTLPRLRHEASEEALFNETLIGTEDEKEIETFFQEQVEQHEFARDAYREESKANQDRIKRIRERAERLIEALEQQARSKAADRTDEKFGKETVIGENLRSDDINSVVNW